MRRAILRCRRLIILVVGVPIHAETAAADPGHGQFRILP